MDDRANTMAGWVLAGGIAALGLTLLSGEIFHAERPEKMGYVVEGVEAEGAAGAAAAPAHPVEFYLAASDPAKGADVFKKCAACHNADNGGANGLGPNLWGVVGEPIGQGAGGFAFSDALKSKGGNWDLVKLNEWLTSPKAYAPGTKMTFAGLSKPEDRANVIAFLNQHGASPQPMPAAPAEGAAATPPATGGTTTPGAENGDKVKGAVPAQTEAQAAKQPKGNIAGEAAPAVSGRAEQRK